MARLLTAFPRSFARLADGAAAGTRRRTCAEAAVARRRVTALVAWGRAVAEGTVPPVEDPEQVDAGEATRGPGWFESSWDLRCGLEVREGLPGDLGANEWLEAFCASGPSAVAAA